MPEVTSEAAPQERPPTSAFVEAFGGKRGLVDSGLPAVVFVFVNSVVQALRGGPGEPFLLPALVAAVGTGLAIVVVRLLRRETLQQAVSGFLGVAVAAWFANRTGEARGFFLPGILVNCAYAAAFLVSAVVGRPLVGAVVGAVEGLGSRWRTDPELRRVFALATAGWALGVFGLRAAVQGALYLADRPGWLAVARLLMGWPLTITAVALTLLATRRVLRERAGTPA